MPTLRELRAAKLLTIRDLADRAGVATRTIVQIEAGRLTPRFATMRKIAAALGAEPGEVTEFAAAIEAAGRRGGGGLSSQAAPAPDGD